MSRGRLHLTIRGLFAASSIVVVVLALAASGSTNKAEKVGGSSNTTAKGSSTNTTAKSSSTTGSEGFKVGDVVKLGDWTVKVWGVKDPQNPMNEFSKPDAGNRWVSLDSEVTNLSDKPGAVSSLLCFTLHDSANHDYTEDIMAGVTPGPPDGEVAPNDGKRGNIVFQVPTSAKGLELHFKCDLFSSGTAIIKL